MNASTTPRTAHTSRIARARKPRVCLIEPLEDRRLLSGSWTTLTQLSSDMAVRGLAADSLGNLYLHSDLLAANLQERTPGSPAFTTIFQSSGSIVPQSMTTDPAGNLFLGMAIKATNPETFQVYERRAGGTTISPIGPPLPAIGLMATDAAGDLYVLSDVTVVTTVKKTTSTTPYGVVQKLVPDVNNPTGYDLSTIYRTANISVHGIAVSGAGGSASIVVLATDTSNVRNDWIMIDSRNGGATWTQTDNYRFDPSGPTDATAIAADSAGRFYVAGWGQKSTTTTTITGYDKRHQPIYTTTTVNANDWIVRKSVDGGATWTTDDDFVMSAAHHANEAYGIAIDSNGAVYVGGGAFDATGARDSVIRTNAGGSWSTSLVKHSGSGEGDARGYAFMAADGFGNIFATGYGDGPIIHELPAAPSLLSATTDPLQPSTQISLSFTNHANPDSTALQLFRSANGGPFTLIATLAPNATTFTDSNLSPNTTYSYYLVSLLNQDGSSNPSNILTLTTDLISI